MLFPKINIFSFLGSQCCKDYNLIFFQTLSPLGSTNREEIFCFQKKFLKIFAKTPPKNRSLFQTSEGVIKFFEIGRFWVCISAPFVQMSERSFSMARLSKKLKQEWDFFINPKTGRRTYNDLCRKCRNNCKQSFRAIVVCCPLYCSKRSVKSVPNGNDFNDSG